MSYTIKETSKRTRLTLHTIRHYCDLGLIPSLQRDKNNNRIFDEASIHWLYAIKFLRQSQMSLKEIHQFLKNTNMTQPSLATVKSCYKKPFKFLIKNYNKPFKNMTD